MKERNCEFVLQLAEEERDFLLETAKCTNLPVADLILLSLLELKQPTISLH